MDGGEIMPTAFVAAAAAIDLNREIEEMGGIPESAGRSGA
jgi:hypothetical protein